MEMSVIFFCHNVVTKLSLFDPTAAGPNYFNGINCSDHCGIVAFNCYYYIAEIIAKCVMFVSQTSSVASLYSQSTVCQGFSQKKKNNPHEA